MTHECSNSVRRTVVSDRRRLGMEVLHYTPGIIREATAALLEDMTGHWVGGPSGGGFAGVNYYRKLLTVQRERPIVEE